MTPEQAAAAAEEALPECGTIRPGTLGYQQCYRPRDHDGPHRSQDRGEWDETS